MGGLLDTVLRHFFHKFIEGSFEPKSFFEIDLHQKLPESCTVNMQTDFSILEELSCSSVSNKVVLQK